MRFIKFNNEKISKLALGSAQFGIKYGIANKNNIPTQKKVKEIINYAYKNKINLFDTAQAYGNSENKIGNSLGNKKSFVVSKIYSKNLFKENSVKKSLIKTRQKSLFALLLHDGKKLKHWKKKEEKIIASLKKNKQIKYFGVSIYSNLEFNLAIKNKEINCIEIPFSILDQRAIKYNWIQKAKKNNKLLLIRSVFLQGLLLMDNINTKNEFARKYIEQFSQISHKLNTSKLKLALSFVDTLAPNSVILFGCDNIYQAKDTIKTYNNLKTLISKDIQVLLNTFSNIPESIFNPTKWN